MPFPEAHLALNDSAGLFLSGSCHINIEQPAAQCMAWATVAGYVMVEGSQLSATKYKVLSAMFLTPRCTSAGVSNMQRRPTSASYQHITDG